MEHMEGEGTCDLCYEKGLKRVTKYRKLYGAFGDEVVWYECGHVYIIEDSTVLKTHDFAER